MDSKEALMGDGLRKRAVKIRLIHSDQEEITTHCPHCQKIVHRTSYSIILIDDTEKYIFLSDVSAWCCVGEITVPLGFDDEKSAEKARREIMDTMSRDGHTGSYELQLLPHIQTRH